MSEKLIEYKKITEVKKLKWYLIRASYNQYKILTNKKQLMYYTSDFVKSKKIMDGMYEFPNARYGDHIVREDRLENFFGKKENIPDFSTWEEL